MQLSYIRISKYALEKNIDEIRKNLSSGTKLACVVKANAYGHGLEKVVKTIEKKVDFFQIDDIEELRRIRKITTIPVLVLGFIQKQDIEEAVKNDAILAIYSQSQLEQFHTIGKKLEQHIHTHLAIDALLGREGIRITMLEEFLSLLQAYPFVRLDGIYAHFANIEDTDNLSYAKKQITIYNRALEICKTYGYSDLLNHISATSGIIRYEKNKGLHSLVRLGIGLYGLWPSQEIQKYAKKKYIHLIPVLTWVTHVAQIKILSKNQYIGYGLSYMTKEETKIALIPQGYSDGYDRKLSNNGEVLIRGKRCKVLGRIAMNMFVVDVTHVDTVDIEDEVVIIGKQDNEEITVEEIATKVGTINYEIIARISSLLPRVFE